MPRVRLIPLFVAFLAWGFSSQAGDILRGGTAIGVTKRSATGGGTAGADNAARTQANARDRLSRTTQTLTAMKAMQAAARNAASPTARAPGPRSPVVFNGLGKGGLQLADGVPKNLNKPKKGESPGLWVGADLPKQTGSKKGGDVNVTIVQNEQQAILNWKTFNVGKKTTLTFDQSAGGTNKSQWVAFNKVNDPSGRPSQILGSIQADGQVYVINQNGIIFGGGSQVNVHTLVASGLRINDNLITRGLLDNPNAEFLFNARQVDSLLGLIAPDTPNFTLTQILDGRSTATVAAVSKDGLTTTVFETNKDFTLKSDPTRKTTLTFTTAGLDKLQSLGEQKSLSVDYSALAGDVTANKGSSLLSPTSAAKVGGRIMLVGSNVKAAGTISAVDGQTILAAGLQVGIDSHKSSDASLRGLDIYVGAVRDVSDKARTYSGVAQNTGVIEASRGNVFITGKQVDQLGIIDSSTSVSLNGRVDLVASYDAVTNLGYDATKPLNGPPFLYKSTGAINLGKGSVIRILPEIDSSEAAIGTKVALASQINLRGQVVHLGPDALVLAPNASVNVDAGIWDFISPVNPSAAQPARSVFRYAGGQIYADSGALIDVAGTTDAAAPLSENILTLQFRGAELSNSPLQRTGVLRATDLTIDIRNRGIYNGHSWVGTPLADATGYANLIERTVAQLTTVGGSVSLHAGGSVVLQPGSGIDVSGGWVRYGAGFVETSLVTAGNRVIDIADATPDIIYDGIYTAKFVQTHSKWGIEKIYKNPLSLSRRHYEPSYLAGRDGGSITLIAPTMALDGKLTGNTNTETHQLRNAQNSTELPVASRLSISFKAQDPTFYPFTQFPEFSPRPPKIIFAPSYLADAADPFEVDELGVPMDLRPDRARLVVLSPDLVNKEGFGYLSIDNSDGRIVLPANVSLEMQPRATAAASESLDADTANIDFKASNLDIRGRIDAPGGILKFTAYNFSPYQAAIIASDSTSPNYRTPYPNANRGKFLLGPTAVLSTAGRVLDDRPSNVRAELDPIVTKGGTINIQSYSAILQAGSLIDVSGGAYLSAARKISYGDAGSVSLSAGQDPSIASLLGGKLVLGATLKGYSGSTGGSLSIQAPLIRVGAPETTAQTFALSPSFFNQGGFASFALTGIGARPFRPNPLLSGNVLTPTEAFRVIPDNRALPGLTIEPGTTIAPVVQSLLAQSVSSGRGDYTLEPTVLPEGLRSPISLSFSSKGVTDPFSRNLLFRGDLTVGEAATIASGPQGKVTLRADTVGVWGSLIAPGGAIKVTGAAAFPEIGRTALASRTTVYFAPGSVVDASGRAVLVPDDYGYRKGSVLPGGSIEVFGSIFAAARSQFDVSGASATLDLDPAQVGLSPYAAVSSGVTTPLYRRVAVATDVASDGGSITLSGSSQLVVDSDLRGAAGGRTASGGSLKLSSGTFLLPNVVSTPKDVNLVVTQSGSRVAPDFLSDGSPAIGSVLRDKFGKVVPGQGYFAADRFTEGGFGSLTLAGVVRFLGPVAIAASQKLSVASGGFLQANDAVNLTAPYVQLGTPFLGPLALLDPARISAFQTGGQPFYTPPRFGSGSLTVRASLIDIGNLSLQNIGLARLFADGGDIRGDGTLEIAGHLILRAGQLYPATNTSFTIAAYDYRLPRNLADKKPDTKAELKFHPGSVTVLASGTRRLPISAGGELNIYGAKITQAGILRAPLGTIKLGWDGSGDAPQTTLSGRKVAVTDVLRLAAGGMTSVSAADRGDGVPLYVPYGIVENGTSWIDPRGVDITGGGVTVKDIRLGAKNLATDRGSVIDLRGGGNLYAYNWVTGQGGTEDILASSGSFAVIPGYQAVYAPFAPFNTTTDSSALGGDPGYTNPNLSVGDRVYLGASDGLAAGTYTLMPARYALLPGAVLVTPSAKNPMGTVAQPDGSSLVSGYRYNALDATRQSPGIFTRFEVAPASVFRARAEYEDYFASSFLRKSARALDSTVPRLPGDAGHLVFEAVESLRLQGAVNALPAGRGIGAYIDISSPGDIFISSSKTKVLGQKGAKNALVLDASEVSNFNAESLLIGGVRNTTATGTTVEVNTPRITVDNAGTPLTGAEIVLVADQELTLAPRAEIIQSGTMGADAERLLVDGDGVLLRVSSDVGASIIRTGVTSAKDAKMTIGQGAIISGPSLILDSSYATALDANAHLLADAVSLSSGQISLRLNQAGDLLPTDGLVLAGAALRGLQGVQSLSLLSYSSIDIYGQGGLAVDGRLELHAGEIRGFASGAGRVLLSSGDILLDNRGHATRPGSIKAPNGTLAFEAETIRLGTGRLDFDQYANLNLTASDHLYIEGVGRLSNQGDITIDTPYITAKESARERILAGGNLALRGGDSAKLPSGSGLGASLALQGAKVTVNTNIYLPSGRLNVRALAGNLEIGGLLDVGGAEKSFYDLVKYTNGGQITLAADQGSVEVTRDGVLAVAARSGGGDAGTLSVSIPNGRFNLAGKLLGQSGAGGKSATFILDVKNLGGLTALNDKLDEASFFESRQIRVRQGDAFLGGKVIAHEFRLSTDAGSITVGGLIDASGQHGGRINLSASGSLVLLDGAKLTAAAREFDAAGKGGAISLEAGALVDGTADSAARLDIRSGSVVDLGVSANTATSADQGQFTGTLHLRAPQDAATGNTEVQINALAGSIRGASSIVIEGYQIFDLTATGGLIDDAVKAAVLASGENFVGVNGTNAATYDAMHDRLLALRPNLDSVVSIRPGIEIVNRAGSLTLGASNSTGDSDWSLDTYRFGAKSAPGVLTLRASENLVFFNALQDGFAIDPSLPSYTAPLMAFNPLQKANAQSWSFRLTAGADLGSADFRGVKALSLLAANTGSLLLGKNAGVNYAPPFGTNAQTSKAIGNRYQVIRTGSGDIDISAGRDVQLLNQFATIYTAGTVITDPTKIPGGFDVPILSAIGSGPLGSVQQTPSYPAQYSFGGGNVNITAQGDITHLTLNNLGELIADSTRELPNNWLYRRGYVDPTTGTFGVAHYGDVASTTWWVDFSNFFEGVGALGGGHVSLIAGNDISNVDAVVPTNARMSKGIPDVSKLVELGGGNLLVRAGNNIDAGVYYVERGTGTLEAGNTIHTNVTRTPSRGVLINEAPLPEQNWLPTTLFLGKGRFDVSARGDLTLGPVANPFLLPGGFNNTYWYKTYFSTYSSNSAVAVSSLGGSVNLKTSTTLPGESGAGPFLRAWFRNVLLFRGTATAAYYQPWLRLNETNVDSFTGVTALMPGTLKVTAFSRNINLVGSITLTPAPKGTIDLTAGGSINGLQINGLNTTVIPNLFTWGSSQINVSDASPSSIPRVVTPYAYQAVVGGEDDVKARSSGRDVLAFVDNLFKETGSLNSVLQTKQTLHGNPLLHEGDSNPIHVYAGEGDISGLSLFAGKSARIVAGNDITDIAFYLQNVSESDVSVVSAGRDIIPYNANSVLRTAALSPGNVLNSADVARAGDIQVGGEGSLEVLAGRNLDLGIGENNSDGTGSGIVTIGNTRNPYLPDTGASIIAGAGLRLSAGLGDSALDFDRFNTEFVLGDSGDRYLSELPLDGDAKKSLTAVDFAALSPDAQRRVALQVFYLALRDAGRDRNLEGSPNFGNYDAGFAAIASLFGTSKYRGDINTRSRDIRTKAGGAISLFAPGGKLTLSTAALDNQLAPPGVITETGGDVNIFARDNVDIGIGRIFTLRGGNMVIWSSEGDIAAGSASKTVASAPPTRVIIDPQSADVKTDLAGLATGGGIGVLATVEGVAPGDVDLIAPTGVIDAGDAGIRVSGNLNLAATAVLNASNISVAGTSAGVPAAAPPSSPNISGLTSAANTAGAGANSANSVANQARQQPTADQTPSDITVEVIGYGGGDGESASAATPGGGA